MRLGCTKKLLEYLGVKPEKSMEPVETIFEWTANLIVVNRRKTLVVVHTASRSIFVIHGLTAKLRGKLPELILEGIRTLLQSEYVRPEIIERYLDECGQDVVFQANSSRSAVANCNKACERVQMFSELFEPGDLFQKSYLSWINDDIGKNGYVPKLLIDCLKERYGEDIQSCRALELEVELKLHTPCKRRIIVPEDLNFYQLHRVLQKAFEWHDCHLHQFVLPGKPVRILHPGSWEDEEAFEDSTQITLGEVFHACKLVGYEYDFGDGWEHIIRLKRGLEDCAEPYPHCIQAVGDAPMEDSGGPEGFAEIRMILQDPAHPAHNEISDWVRGVWWYPVDVSKINLRMKDAWRRCIPAY